MWRPHVASKSELQRYLNAICATPFLWEADCGNHLKLPRADLLSALYVIGE